MNGNSDEDPVSVPGVQPCSQLARLVGTTEPSGDALSSRELDCLGAGPRIDVSALRGQPVLINLWASWCGPCREEMPVLQAAYKEYGGSVMFVGVDTKDGSANAAAFLAKVGVTYPQLSDPDAGLLGDLRSPGLPVTVVLGADGSVVERRIGPFDEGDLKALLDRIALG